MPAKPEPGQAYVLNQDLSWEKDGEQVVAKRGETRTDIPEKSLKWLVQQELVTAVKRPANESGATSGDAKKES